MLLASELKPIRPQAAALDWSIMGSHSGLAQLPSGGPPHSDAVSSASSHAGSSSCSANRTTSASTSTQ